MWIFKNEIFDKEKAEEKISQGCIGFVYEITDNSNGKKYIGKKLLTTRKKRPPLKGTKKKRISVEQSDWEKYYGSNEIIKEAVKNRKDDFKREILEFCFSKGELSYTEARLQFEKEVLLCSNYYNSFIGCKIHANHVKNLWKK